MTVQELKEQLTQYSGNETVLIIPPQEFEVESVGKFSIGTRLLDVLYVETICRVNEEKNEKEKCVLLIC